MSILREIYDGLKTPLTSSSDGKYTMSIRPTDGNTRTEFNFAVVYNCEGNNAHLKSLVMLKDQWNDFVAHVVSQPVIEEYFTFDSAEDLIEVEDPEPSEPTLPPDDEQLKNGSSVSTMTSGVALGLVDMTMLL